MKKKNKRQFNADLYLSSINIATKLPPLSIEQHNHVKKHYVMSPICGR